MAEPLKDSFGPEIPAGIAAEIASVISDFDTSGFINTILADYDGLSLTGRGWAIAHAMHKFLPADFPSAADILVKSLGPKLEKTDGLGMAPFHYMPHIFYISEYGIEHFEASMDAQYELTQRFTAEFSIRSFIERYPEQTMARLYQWTGDPSVHVRRLVSEGTRPRLPWAPRLKQFQADPGPILPLLEKLKDDPELYVRRSVANNLNDIGKDNPEVLYDIAARWLNNASPEREWLVRHALRSAIKRGEAGALAVLGYDRRVSLELNHVELEPNPVKVGQKLAIAFTLRNLEKKAGHVLVDLRVHFIKASGKTSPKVFKLREVEIGPDETAIFKKTISLRNMTTRKHYAGLHKVDYVVNGHPAHLANFELVD